MKVGGWIILIWGIIAFMAGIAAAANGAAAGSSYLGGGIGFCVIGAYLIHRAKQKEEEKNEHDNWSNE